jgi:hypothetical protein
MLEKLDAIDWPKLHHAYGAAGDVPDQLRALISPDPEHRDKALYELFGNIFHQHTIFEATSYAVPFLWEILGGPAPCDRRGVASLIGCIAEGGGYNSLRPTRDEAAWIADIRVAVRKGLGTAIALLDSPDDTLRTLCAYILAHYPEDTAQSVPALRAALAREDKIERRAALGITLMLLGEQAPGAFASEKAAPLPLERLRALAQRAVDGFTDPLNLMEVIFELALPKVSVENIVYMLDDRERWGGEDDLLL